MVPRAQPLTPTRPRTLAQIEGDYQAEIFALRAEVEALHDVLREHGIRDKEWRGVRSCG